MHISSTLLSLGLTICLAFSSCQKEVHIHYHDSPNSQTELRQKPKVSYATGLAVDANTGLRSFSIQFLSEAGTIQELSFDGEWEFTFSNGNTLLRLNERDFTWKADGRKLTGTATIDLSNYLSQPGVQHKIKRLRYRVCINGQWWQYEN